MGYDHTSKSEKADGSPGASGAGLRIALVVSDFNREITAELERGAIEELKQHGVNAEDILTLSVPGAFELPLGAQSMFEKYSQEPGQVDAVICLGCVIRGETTHYDFICNSCASALQKVALKYGKPVIAGVLTTESIKQASARAGGDKGHKGRDSALAALKMVYALSSGERPEKSVENIISSTVDVEAAG